MDLPRPSDMSTGFMDASRAYIRLLKSSSSSPSPAVAGSAVAALAHHPADLVNATASDFEHSGWSHLSAFVEAWAAGAPEVAAQVRSTAKVSDPPHRRPLEGS